MLMPLIVTCEDCSTKHWVKDSAAGKSLTCKQCGSILTVPSVVTDESHGDMPSTIRPLDADELAPAGWSVSRASQPAQEPIAVKPLSGSSGLKIRRFVLSMVLLPMVLFVSAWVCGIVLEAVRSSFWSSVEGTVVRSEVVRAGKGSWLDFRYRYRVNDVSYDSERVTVAGNSHLFCERPDELNGKYPEKASVRVYYNSRNPEAAALQPGVPLALGVIALVLLLLGALSVLFAWASCAELFGAPRPMVNPDVEDPRSTPQRALLAVLGLLIMVVCGGIAVMCLMLPMTVPPYSRDAFTMVFTTSFGVLFAGMMSLVVWFGSIVFKSAFKRPETINDLRNAPDSPKFSNSSLICFSAGLGSSTAVIVDRDEGMIHFKKCFMPRERAFFSGLTASWWSCSLDRITGLSQMTYKGRTTFIIATPQGNASISTLIDNYAELRQFLENRPPERTTRRASKQDDVELPECLLDSGSIPVAANNESAQEPVDRHANDSPRHMLVKKEYAPGQKPLDGRIALCILGAVFGPFVGLIIGSTVGSRDLGSFALTGILIGGTLGLPFFAVTAQQFGRFVASTSGITAGGGITGVLVHFALKLFIQTQFIDLLVLAGAGALLGFLFARQRAK